MIKAIIFDIGGVILNCQNLSNKLVDIFKPKDKDKFWRDINLLGVPLSNGKISEREYWRKIAQSVGLKSDFKVSDNLWAEDFEKLTSIDQDVWNIMLKLKHNYKVALISNTLPAHAKCYRKQDFLNFFDVVILSCEVGLTKESKDIFMLAIEKLGVKVEECLFVDDIQEFVDVAKSVGMKAILFKNSGQLKSEMKKMGVLI